MLEIIYKKLLIADKNTLAFLIKSTIGCHNDK